MAYDSFPNDAHNNRVITLNEHEQLMVGLGALSGFLFYGGAPVYADSTGLQVKLPAGVWASIRGTRFNNPTTTAVAVGTNTSGKTRVDLLVLRLRRQETSLGAGNQYTIVPFVIAGTPGDNPVAPAPVRDASTGSGFWDIPVAEITVAHNATSIGSAQLKVRSYFITGSGYTGREAWGFPPVEPGLIFRAEDTGVTYIGTNAGTWQKLYEDTGWVNATVVANWSAAPTGRCRVRRIDRITYLQLDLFRTGNSIAAGGGRIGVAFLPDNFEPDQQVIFLGAVSLSGGAARFSIDASRNLVIDMYTAIPKGQAISVTMQWPAA